MGRARSKVSHLMHPPGRAPAIFYLCSSIQIASHAMQSENGKIWQRIDILIDTGSSFFCRCWKCFLCVCANARAYVCCVVSRGRGTSNIRSLYRTFLFFYKVIVVWENCSSYKCENKNHPKAIYVESLIYWMREFDDTHKCTRFVRALLCMVVTVDDNKPSLTSKCQYKCRRIWFRYVRQEGMLSARMGKYEQM